MTDDAGIPRATPLMPLSDSTSPYRSRQGLAASWSSSAFCSWLLIVAFFWIAAAAGFSGYMGKWGLLDGALKNGVEAMLDSTAHKPYVYRRLGPELANIMERVTPLPVKHVIMRALEPELTFARVKTVTDARYRFRYLLLYYFSFAALFGSLFVLRALVLDYGGSSNTALFIPAAFAIALPYLQTVGGYFYDSSELLFTSTAMLAARQGRLITLVLLAVPATLNKETFFFFVPALFPVLRGVVAPRLAGMTLGAMFAVAAAVNGVIKTMLAGARGGAAEFHLLDNISAYLTPFAYLEGEITYGLVGPSHAFLATLAVIAVIVAKAWPHSPASLKAHMVWGSLLNFPLFFLFCAPGELRNLSLLFPGFVVLMAVVADRAAKADTLQHPPGRS